MPFQSAKISQGTSTSFQCPLLLYIPKRAAARRDLKSSTSLSNSMQKKRRWRNFFSLSYYTIFSTFAFSIAIQLRFMPLFSLITVIILKSSAIIFSFLKHFFVKLFFVLTLFHIHRGIILSGFFFFFVFHSRQQFNYFPVAEPKKPSSKCE